MKIQKSNLVECTLCMLVVLCMSVIAGSYEKETLFDIDTWYTHEHTSSAVACSTVYTSDTIQIDNPQEALAFFAFIDSLATGTALRYDADSIVYWNVLYNSWDGSDFSEIAADSADTALQIDTTFLDCSQSGGIPYGQFFYSTRIIWSNDSSGVVDGVTDSVKGRAILRGIVF